MEKGKRYLKCSVFFMLITFLTNLTVHNFSIQAEELNQYTASLDMVNTKQKLYCNLADAHNASTPPVSHPTSTKPKRTPSPQKSPDVSPRRSPHPSPRLSPSPVASPIKSPRASPTPSQGDGGLIYGFVFEDDGDTGMEGVTVTISGDSSGITTTDEEGYFEFSGLDGGDYTLTFDKKGYETQTKDVSIGEDEEQYVEITMEQTGSKLYGYVTDTDGNAIEDAKVKLKKLGKIKKTTTTDTDEKGYYDFSGLDEGNYYVIASKNGYKKARSRITLESDEDKEVNFELEGNN